MRRKYLIGGLALLLAALAAGWWLASPYWTLRQVAEAAKVEDADRLSAHVDYPALREDVKEKLTERLIGATSDDDPAASLGRALGTALLAPMVDAFVSPAGLKAAFARMQLSEKARAATADTGSPKQNPRVERLGLNAFRVGDPARPGAGLLFERRGLAWKLAGIDLPPAKPRAQP